MDKSFDDLTSERCYICDCYVVYFVKSFVDGVLSQICCCENHKTDAIRKLVNDNDSHYGHGENWDNWSGHINMHITVEHIVTSYVEHIHIGGAVFGPFTEIEHLYNEFEEMVYNISLIGMCNFNDTNDRRRAWFLQRYQYYKDRMADIENRIQVLDLYSSIS
jgi:hypothetical protein